MSYFIFVLRNQDSFELRWFFPFLPAMLAFTSKGIVNFSDYVTKFIKIKKIASILIIVIVLLGGYNQLVHADSIIKNKLNSYNGIKQAGLFVKQISSPDDKILTQATPQSTYYSERESIAPNWLAPQVNKDIKVELGLDRILSELEKERNKNLKYLIVTFSEPSPAWMQSVEYAQNPQTSQRVYSKWKIPFMNTTIDFARGQQDIKQEVTYRNLTFKLLTIKDDAFVYEIERK